MNPTKSYFFGIPITIYKKSDLETFIRMSIQKSLRNIIYGFSFHSIYSIPRIPEIIGLGQHADFILTDGRPFYWLIKLFGLSVECNTSIPESVLMSLDIANKNHSSLMLLGSTEILNKRACNNIRIKYPNIKILEGISGYFDFEKDLKGILERINYLKPDILLIGISSPKKEIIAFKYGKELNTGVIIPCGGMIDVLAGKTRMTPRIIKSVGLASLYRAIQEPRRLLGNRIRIYFFVFGNLIPVIFWYHFISKKKNFSLLDYYR